MKFTLSWLKNHLETDASLDQIVDKLTMIGLEVEEVVDAAKDLSAFKVAHVVSAEQHPDADRLRVCIVDTGHEKIQVVCGAPNARTGMKGVFAPSGTVVPGTGMLLKPTKIRGVESNGMLVSEREMGMSDEHDGIIEVPQDTQVGTPFAEVVGLDDPMIEIAITPNRPDCLGVRGIARDLAAGGLGSLKPDTTKELDGKFDSPIGIDLKFDVDRADACSGFAGCYVRGVKNGPSPQWMQRQLKAIGLRPINALVDITNYVAYDRCRPLHVYDADKLTGNIHARMGKTGETLAALDGKEYKVDEEICVIADDAAVLGFGGIMGGEASGCTEDTVNVFIESAFFDPIRTAATGRRLGIESDARYRFERGIDPACMEPGIDLAADLVTQLCGGEPSKMVLAGKAPLTNTEISFKADEIKRLAGIDVNVENIKTILTDLGFNVADDGSALKVTVPTWRPDVHGRADLVEEIVRIVGVDNIPAVALPKHNGTTQPMLTVGQKRVFSAKRSLAARGMVECVTWSFIPRVQAVTFGGGSDELELANPISTEMSSMRPSLLPGLISASARNVDRGFLDLALFEVGQTYHGTQARDQYMMASGIRVGTAKSGSQGRHWRHAATPVDAYDAKADALEVLSSLRAPVASLQIFDGAADWYHPGRSGTLRLGPKTILAEFGELHPRLLDDMGLERGAVAFEIYMDRLPNPKKRKSTSKPPLQASDLQPVRRDFAFVVAADVKAADIVRAAIGADKALVDNVTVFDVFEGSAIGEGRKSIAIEVTLQPRDKTLTDAEIEAVCATVVDKVISATGGELRG